MVEKINSKATAIPRMPSSWEKAISGRSQDIRIFSFERHLTGGDEKSCNQRDKKNGDKKYRLVGRGIDKKESFEYGNDNAKLIDIVV